MRAQLVNDAPSLLLTCEHGGPRVPREYAPLFAKRQWLLHTHRGYDFGALWLARRMAAGLGAPLIWSDVTRLLVDLNRSVGTPTLFSVITRPLDRPTRERIVKAWYDPYRGRVRAHIAQTIAQGRTSIGIGVHSFTPRYHGQIRKADIGLLYDPRRATEVRFCDLWLTALQQADARLTIRRNYPYLGIGDGVPLEFRKRYSPEQYVGITLELNRSLIAKPSKRRLHIADVLVRSLRATMAGFREWHTP